jgi:hypothetical protein
LRIGQASRQLSIAAPVTMLASEFVDRYLPQPPRRAPANADETRPLAPADGLRRLGTAPADNESWYQPASKGDPQCHLWVIDTSGIPYILESIEIMPPLASGRVTHTNLTGGLTASCGGELWFDTPRARRLYLNGCSGRYGPTTPEQMADAVRVFEALGFQVVSFGWDYGADKPRTVLP